MPKAAMPDRFVRVPADVQQMCKVAASARDLSIRDYLSSKLRPLLEADIDSALKGAAWRQHAREARP